jgi:beta-galactosidase
MPAVTHDGRSFMVDGRRIWLACGRVPYARLPREVWADRIQAAKNAGLNTIETPVFWNRHESRPGRFDFTGQNDLRYFVDLVGKAGMYSILGLGPYVGADWDMGGLPPYLREGPGRDGQITRLRTNSGAFLEACSRFIGAVADQIRGWQLTAPGTGGPIVALQCESEWTCGHELLSQQYLGELTRYIRESGLSVPIVNSNNLWQSVEGQIDAWSGSDQMLAVMRQLAMVRTGHPRLVIDFAAAPADAWGQEPRSVLSARAVERRLAEVLAGGGQFNVTTFCGGTNFGFSGGRGDDHPDSFATHAFDRGCALDQSGALTELHAPLKRVAHLASRFGRVFASLDPAYQPVAIKPAPAMEAPARGAKPGSAKAASAKAQSAKQRAATATGKSDHASTVIHAVGAQGGLAFVFGPEDKHDPALATTLLLGDGTELFVPIGAQAVVWCLLGVNVSPRCHVDYCNLSSLGAAGNLLLLFGPPGARAQLSVNGSPLESLVPTTDAPTVITHEGLVVVIVRDVDSGHTCLSDDAVYVGAAGLSPAGAPLPPTPGAKQCLRVGQDAKPRFVAFEGKSRPGAPKPLALAPWLAADTTDYATGTSARFASVEALSDLTAMGVPHGYGWYRMRMINPGARRARLDFGLASDRLHLYSDGRFAGLVGFGPGATRQCSLSLRTGEQMLVVLAENLGRFAGGINLGEAKGLVDDIYEVRELASAKAKNTKGEPVPLLAYRSPLWDLAEGDSTAPERVEWSLRPHARAQVIIRIDQPPPIGLFLLNDKPFAAIDRSGPSCIIITEEQLSKGANTLALTVVASDNAKDELARTARSIEVFEVVGGLAEVSELGFAKWEPPPESAYVPLAKVRLAGVPAWLRTTFEFSASDRPACLEPIGLTKGQFFVNGRHCGRYFVANRDGSKVPPQDRYCIPASWLNAQGPNDLLIFDEHGASPARVRVTR